MKFATKTSESFAEMVKKTREQRGISQEQLAELAGVHRTYIGYIERGERIPSLDYAERISKALDMNIKDMI